MATKKKPVKDSSPKKQLTRTPVVSALDNYVSSVFPVVGVGSSAGGLEAVTELLRNVAPDCGLAFIFVQHHDPKAVTALPQILGRATKMAVKMAADGMEVAPNTV